VTDARACSEVNEIHSMMGTDTKSGTQTADRTRNAPIADVPVTKGLLCPLTLAWQQKSPPGHLRPGGLNRGRLEIPPLDRRSRWGVGGRGGRGWRRSFINLTG
jgi:hypothetical protein